MGPSRDRYEGRTHDDIGNYVAASPSATANEAGVTEDRPYLAVELVPTLPDPTNVVLVGRATTVPFTAVVTGPERTPTDNVKVVATCAVCHLTRWRPRPIWLWEQGVAA